MSKFKETLKALGAAADALAPLTQGVPVKVKFHGRSKVAARSTTSFKHLYLYVESDGDVEVQMTVSYEVERLKGVDIKQSIRSTTITDVEVEGVGLEPVIEADTAPVWADALRSSLAAEFKGLNLTTDELEDVVQAVRDEVERRTGASL